MTEKIDPQHKKSFTKKFWIRLGLSIVLVPILLFTIVTSIVYLKQKEIVQELLVQVNKDFEGSIRLKGSHVSPFAAFPYISIDLEDLHVYEGKKQLKKEEILHINDCYIGFNIWNILKGNYSIKSVKLSNGTIRLVQHKDGSFNIANALKSKKPVEEVKSDFKIDLKSIAIKDIDFSKLNEANNLLIDAYIQKAKTKVISSDDHFYLDLDTKFKLTVVQNGDTTFVKNKKLSIKKKQTFYIKNSYFHHKS
jgi:uncharacterized protein involved in outer membrane biogenesis